MWFVINTGYMYEENSRFIALLNAAEMQMQLLNGQEHGADGTQHMVCVSCDIASSLAVQCADVPRL